MGVQRVTKMLEKINEKVEIYQLPRKRVANINEIIANEEEQNDEGLITLLEKAYNIISDVRKVIGSTLHQTESTTDDMQINKEYAIYNIPFWEAQSAKFRILFEEQKELQIKLENQSDTIKENENIKNEMEKSIKQKKEMIDILTQQNQKEKEKSTNLAIIQNKNSELFKKNKQFENELKTFSEKISQQNEEISAKSIAIEKYKKAISRIKDKESPLSSSSIQRQPSVTSSSAAEKSIKSNSTFVRHGTILIDSEIEYSSLLQQTVQSLRRKVTELMMTKKLTNCELNLKP